jgi:hypothetical protein
MGRHDAIGKNVRREETKEGRNEEELRNRRKK